MNLIEKLGRSRIAHFEMIGLDLFLKKRDFFHDDGFVNSVTQYHYELDDFYYGEVRRNYGIQPLFGYEEGGLGETFIGHKDGERHIHIFYQKDTSDLENQHRRGHEETHALVTLGGKKILCKTLKEKFNLRISRRIYEKIREKRIDDALMALYDTERLIYVFQTFSNKPEEFFAEIGSFYGMLMAGNSLEKIKTRCRPYGWYSSAVYDLFSQNVALQTN